MRQREIKVLITGLIIVAAAALAACSGPTPTPLPTVTESVLPTAIPVVEPTTPGTLDPSLANLPTDLNGYELLAADLGEAPYSGYACVVSTVGCACGQAVIQTASFGFPEKGKMVYKFASGNTNGEWPMVRIGTGIWSYSQKHAEIGATSGDFDLSLEFINNGFIVTQLWNINGSIVTCPSVTFQRLAAPSP